MEHVSFMEEINAYKILVRILDGKSNVAVLTGDGRAILKCHKTWGYESMDYIQLTQNKLID
jgi:hypothetical protein